MRWIYNDGGRRAAGFKGEADDCVCRSIAIVTGIPYREVYDLINRFAKDERYRRGKLGFLAVNGRGSSARTGVHKPTIRELTRTLGLRWVPTMKPGTGCRVHLRDGELPNGRLLVACSKHITAVINGVIHDTHDPSRNGSRCVYGYWTME